MSENGDILYDPSQHTHVSCVEAVEHADLLILLIGGRFGEIAREEASKLLHGRGQGAPQIMSVTQAEAERALSLGIPVLSFVKREVMSDFRTYRMNPGSDLKFSSIENQATAGLIFDFIERLKSRDNNNGVLEFEKLADIDIALKAQLAQLFQKLLHERRQLEDRKQRLDQKATQFEDLKNAVLASIPEGDSRAAAEGVVRYRQLIEFLLDVPSIDPVAVESYPGNLRETLLTVGVTTLVTRPTDPARPLSILLRFEEGDGLLASSMVPFDELADAWVHFRAVSAPVRSTIVDVLSADLTGTRIRGTRRSNDSLNELVRVWQQEGGVVSEILHRPGQFGTMLAIDPLRPMAEATEYGI